MISEPQIPTISNADAQARVPGGAQLIDVRTDAEYAEDHAKGAIHVPLDSLLKMLPQAVDTDAQILVICKSGGRSAQAVKQLRELGFDAYNVEGGTDEWRASGGPMLEHNTARHVSALKAQELLAEGVAAVDVRSPEQYAAGHVAGAVNLPFSGDAEQLKAQFSKTEPVLLFCNTGGFASLAGQALTEAGWNPLVVAGGTNAWKALDGKMEFAG
ncbi:rhodanese-like domain-containing protein [Boudabousia marimammalium]|uniref:Rhodanese domain-containing protein n=1 Tax=Boudabousia marimammalium TaxID=156892 RepID=A0A1Q5PS77_9ACTO|nr:rhodanese-like domain-containing protein [Boudabousia marimammalium]OKL50359.1 hypothetical protein BM477_02980 [Boudabousia marimammalium]